MRSAGASIGSRVLLSLLLCVSISVRADDQQSARERYNRFRSEATKAYRAKDYRGAREIYERWHAFVPNSPAPVYNLACVNALLGQRKSALQWLNLYVRMGQVADFAKDPDLASLANSAELKKIVSREKSRARAAAPPSTWMSLGSEELVEDVAYDPDEHAYYVSSLLGKRVLKISKDKKITVAADLSRDPGWPVFAVAVQRGAHPVLWVTVAAMPDFAASPKGDWGKSLLLKIDGDTGRVIERLAPPEDGEAHVLGDMALAQDGTIVVSDGQSGAVYLMKAGTKVLRRIDRGEFVSPQSPAFAADDRHVLVADYARGIARIDLKTRRVDWLKAPEDAALTGIDGLYLHGSRLIAVQNGTSPTRIVRLFLPRDLGRISKLEVLAQGADADDINHGVLEGAGFYFISHAGWDCLDAKGNRKPDAKKVGPELRQLWDVTPEEVESKR